MTHYTVWTACQRAQEAMRRTEECLGVWRCRVAVTSRCWWSRTRMGAFSCDDHKDIIPAVIWDNCNRSTRAAASAKADVEHAHGSVFL